MPSQHKDSYFMQNAIAMANMAVGTTSPNPSVGCVIVKDGKILSAAHTAKNGRPHAEAIALAEAGNAANGACAYVTLEPCAHHGQTPPCAEGLINAGIKRVVIACQDPFAKVNGKGIKMLKDAGIEVITGVCEVESKHLNEGFFSVQQRIRPFITLKTATSLDGKIALKNGISKWITGEKSRNYVHLMRARHDAIITGIATIMADDPLLTCRLPGMEDRSPIRVVLDTKLSLPIDSQLAKTAKTTPCWVFTLGETVENQQDKASKLEDMGVKLFIADKAGNGKVCMDSAFSSLAKNSINTAMIEAGAAINTAALKLSLVDRLAWFKAPVIIGNDGMAAFGDMQMESLVKTPFKLFESKVFDEDVLNIYDISQ